MRSRIKKTLLGKSGLAASLLLLVTGAATAQTVSLTAAPGYASLPDGQQIPMWGYSCDTGASSLTTGATCVALNGAPAGAWSPVIITVPYTADGTGASTTSLTISLTNNLTFTPITPSGAKTHNIPTSLTIVGQLGGGLGDDPRAPSQLRTDPAKVHNNQGTTWPGTLGGTNSADCPSNGGTGGTFCPPTQSDRVRSFGTEVAAGTTVPLTWNNLRPGTYLIESGTHPSIQGPMGLYGILIVTTAPASASSGVA